MSGFAPSGQWQERWSAAGAAIGVISDCTAAEMIALGAIMRFRLLRPPPGAKTLRAAVATVPELARQLGQALRTIRDAANATPATQPQRRAVLADLALALEHEFALDPAGVAGRTWPILGAPTPFDCAAARAETHIGRAAIDRLPPAPPRAPRPAFDALIAGLGSAYSAVKGSRPSAATNSLGFVAPFVRFVWALWAEASDQPPPGCGAIAAALRRINAIPADRRRKASGLPNNPTDGMTSCEETAHEA